MSEARTAGTLTVNGQMVRITVRGRVTGTGNGTPRVKFGATYLDASAAIIPNAWAMEFNVVRTGAATQVAGAQQLVTGANPTLAATAPTETLSGAVTNRLSRECERRHREPHHRPGAGRVSGHMTRAWKEIARLGHLVSDDRQVQAGGPSLAA